MYRATVYGAQGSSDRRVPRHRNIAPRYRIALRARLLIHQETPYWGSRLVYEKTHVHTAPAHYGTNFEIHSTNALRNCFRTNFVQVDMQKDRFRETLLDQIRHREVEVVMNREHTIAKRCQEALGHQMLNW